MKKFLFIFLLNLTSFAQSSVTDAKYIFDDNNIIINFDMKLQFVGKLPKHNTFNLLSTDTRGDAREMLNTQFFGYDIQVRIYKNIFASFQQHFSYDHTNFEEYDNVSDNTILMKDINDWYTRYTFSLLYYFRINNNQFNINLGMQRTNSSNYITVAKKNRITNMWTYKDYWFSSYSSSHIEFDFIKNNMQIGIGYEFGNNIDFYNFNDSYFSMYYFRLAYSMFKW